MQCAAIEFARNVCNFVDANSTEFNPDTERPVIALMDSQLAVTEKGGTMRLGAYPCKVLPETHTAEAYGVDQISERHRHRFEFNNKFREIFQSHGMIIAGVLPDDSLVEIIELRKEIHPWFVGCQFHPELKSRPKIAMLLFGLSSIAQKSYSLLPKTRYLYEKIFIASADDYNFSNRLNRSR